MFIINIIIIILIAKFIWNNMEQLKDIMTNNVTLSVIVWFHNSMQKTKVHFSCHNLDLEN